MPLDLSAPRFPNDPDITSQSRFASKMFSPISILPQAGDWKLKSTSPSNQETLSHI